MTQLGDYLINFFLSQNSDFSNTNEGTSHVVEWIRICLPVQGTQVYCCSLAFQETDSPRRTMQIVECSLLHGGAQGRVSS